MFKISILSFLEVHCGEVNIFCKFACPDLKNIQMHLPVGMEEEYKINLTFFLRVEMEAKLIDYINERKHAIIF